jgi:hypothetical protein
MVTNDNNAKRENRVWLSCPKNLLKVQDKLLELYEKEDIYAEGLRTLGKKHACLPELSEGEGGANLEMNMHLHAPIQSAAGGIPSGS